MGFFLMGYCNALIVPDPSVVIHAKAHCCPEKSINLCRSVQYIVIPAKAGRSAKRGERPKDGPEGVSEANHLAT